MKTAVIYWSGTGNTEAMAKAVAEGANAELFEVSEFSGNIADYDAIAFGCPAMGAEVLEETEFEPMFASVETSLGGKKIGIFGSYGWGDGQWMRDWKDLVMTASHMPVQWALLTDSGHTWSSSARALPLSDGDL